MRSLDVKSLGMERTRSLLKKPPFDQVKVSDRIREKNKEMFGEDLSAAQVVEKIVDDVRGSGDEAILRYTKLIDGVDFDGRSFAVSDEEYEEAEKIADRQVMESIRKATENVRAYHMEQKPRSWMTYRAHGSLLGQSVRALDRVGIYVPGGTAAYPSSAIMNAVPAAVAGVGEILMAVPPDRQGKVNPYVLMAAREAGVHRIFKMGGAQAIAAFAFGTKTVPRADKITGPGNIFVTLAKKAVYGYADIDMLAGPSEILIVADDTADPRYVAADMLSQAEHDPLASSIVVTDSAKLAKAVELELKTQLARLPRKAIAETSLENNGLMIVAENMMQAMELVNASAPEHLEILTADPFRLLPYVRHAGAVFLGQYSPEPLGDYLAGPNHVLPTGGTARFYSVLNVETFMKRTSIVSYTKEALDEARDDIVRLAETEGLTAHAEAIRIRGRNE